MNPDTNNQPNPVGLPQQGGTPQPQMPPQQMAPPPQPDMVPVQPQIAPQMPQPSMPAPPQPMQMPPQPTFVAQPQMPQANIYPQPTAAVAPQAPGMPGQVPVMQSANTSGFAKGGGKKRNIIVAVATLLAVALLAGAAWFGFQKFASAPLETATYEGKGYSIVYPSEGWEKEEIGDEVTFSKDLDGNYKSSITVRTSYVGETSAAQEEEALNILLESMTKEELAKSMGEDVVVGEFESKIEDRNGRKEFIVRATLKEKKTADAIVTARAFVANEQINMALVGVYEKTDKALYNNVDVVIDSFTVK